MLTLFKAFVFGIKLSVQEKGTVVHFLLTLIPMLIMQNEFTQDYFSVSYWYHAIKSQSTLKLYGVLMMLENIDKMLYNFGEYFISELMWSKLQSCKSIRKSILHIVVCLAYVLIHSIFLFTLLIIYNVFLNSDYSLFIIMIFVNNAMKMKSQIFKKLTEYGYTSQSHPDIRNRYQKFLFIILSYIMNSKGFAPDIYYKFIALLISEYTMQWFIYLSMAKFNQLKQNIFDNAIQHLNEFVHTVIQVQGVAQGNSGAYVSSSYQAALASERATRQPPLNKSADAPSKTIKVEGNEAQERLLLSNQVADLNLKLGVRINFIVFPYAILIGKIIIPKIPQIDFFFIQAYFMIFMISKLVIFYLLYSTHGGQQQQQQDRKLAKSKSLQIDPKTPVKRYGW